MKEIKNLDKKILKTLKNFKNPISTRMIALKTGRAWHSVLKVCNKLKSDNKISGFQAGRMHLWSLKKR